MSERKPSGTNDERLASMETVLYRMEERLFGNGQPGILDKHDEQLREHDRKFSFQQGALWSVGALLTLLEIVHIILQLKHP